MAPWAYCIYEILKNFQVLAAGVFAVVAAVIGFAGVRHAQKKTLENAEKERKHRDQLEKRRREREAHDQMLAVASALCGELSAIDQDLRERIGSLKKSQEAFKNQYKSGDDIGDPRMYVLLPTPIFDVYVKDIGRMSPSIIRSISYIYFQLKNLEGSPVEFPKPTTIDHLLESYGMFVTIFEGIAPTVRDVVNRLHAVRLGHPDPGPGKGEEFWKGRGDPEQF